MLLGRRQGPVTLAVAAQNICCVGCAQSLAQVPVIPFHIHICFKVTKQAGSLPYIIGFF